MITVFGGTGFLGSAIVGTLQRQGSSVRVATRHPEREQTFEHPESVVVVQADVRDEVSVEAALEDSRAVVNAVGLYVEKEADTFKSVHVHGAGNVARIAARVGVERLVHVSGIGASTSSSSSYVRARAGGERIVSESYPDATIVRPSVLFGSGDSFLSTIDGISRLSPVFPLFGSGDTRLQPVFVEDVAEAVAQILEDSTTRARISELGGPRIYSYREIINAVLHYRGRRRVLLPIPFGIWTLQARLLALTPDPPLTEDQVVLMRDDNVVGKGAATFDDLGIVPRNLETLLPLCLGQEPGTEDDS